MISISETLVQSISPAPSGAGLKALSKYATLSEAPANQKLFATGDKCENFVLITEGQARVQISTRTGREIILFRIKAGESCALTTSCLLSHSPYYAEAISETPLKIITIPAAIFRTILQNHPELSISLLDNYAQRIGELTSIIDRLTSRDLNAELKDFLIENADGKNVVHFSHQKIADELGSSREVISRKLKSLENLGFVKLARGKISLLFPS